jgi:Fe-coproporphyrin III synthase
MKKESFRGTHMGDVKAPQSSGIPLLHSQLIRGPSQISFDITNRCNYRCLHCYNRSGENLLIHDELHDDEIMGFIRDIAGVKPYSFCFCGGEPLLRKNILYRAAHHLSSHGITVSIVTNGSYVTKEVVERLLTSGVTGAQVSLDGATPKTHEKLRCHANAFRDAVQAVRLFHESGGFRDIGVAYSPTSFNWNEVEQTYRLSMRLGATSFRIQPLILQGRTQQQTEEFLPTPMQYRSIVRTIHSINAQGGVLIDWGDPVDHLIRFRTTCEHCVNFSHIKANGGIALSPYLPVIVGNIRRHSFHDYWDAGLGRAWELSTIKALSCHITSIQDFGRKNKALPRTWFEKDIVLDIIDDNSFKGEAK